jgi:hypothetical protein
LAQEREREVTGALLFSVSYRSITDMGGSVTVSNRDGGAWFQLRLPAAGTEAAGPEQP